MPALSDTSLVDIAVAIADELAGGGVGPDEVLAGLHLPGQSPVAAEHSADDNVTSSIDRAFARLYFRAVSRTVAVSWSIAVRAEFPPC